MAVPPSASLRRGGGDDVGEGQRGGLAVDELPADDHHLVLVVGPFHQRHGDAPQNIAGDGVLDGLLAEGIGDALHLQTEFMRIDAVGAVDRKHQGEVDIERGGARRRAHLAGRGAGQPGGCDSEHNKPAKAVEQRAHTGLDAHRLLARRPPDQLGVMPRSRSERLLSNSTMVKSMIEMMIRMVATARMVGEICSRMPDHIWRGMVRWS